MFRRLAAEHDLLDELCRVETLVRDRFGIPESDLVLVSQDAGDRPGFPPLLTSVVFWKDGTRYRTKIFSPLADIAASDLPVRWLLPALEDTGELDCC